MKYIRKTFTPLSILYWFYFLPNKQKMGLSLKKNFQSYIGSIFSSQGQLYIQEHHPFNPILVLFSLGYPFMPAFSTLLSILYWFYFLLRLFPCSDSGKIFFQSYIGSIFSISFHCRYSETHALSILYWFYFL